MIGFRLAQAGLRAAAAPARRALERALADPERAQDAVLGRILAGSERTEYGRAHGVSRAMGYAAFRDKVPTATYDELSPWLERQRREEGTVLVPEPVLFYERTSGSTAAAKLIPYTASLKRAFNRLFLVWAADVLRHTELHTGKAFLSVSPSLGTAGRTERGVRIGLEDDREHLSGSLRRFTEPFFVAPPSLSRLKDPEAFQDGVCLHLLAHGEGLELMSLWNPSWFLALLDRIAADRARMAGTWKAGAFRAEGLEFPLPEPCPGRLRSLENGAPWAALWPNLAMISCWADAGAQAGAARLRELFPMASVQGKGLLATESPVTLPLVGAGGCVPLLTEAFLEFEGDDGRVSRLHELEPGGEYGLLVSQAAGLLRYRLGDRVRVSGLYRRTPRLAFMGRSGVSDLAGEKLSEGFAARALGGLCAGAFRLLVPDGKGYRLIVDGGDAERAARELESALRESPRYREARVLGQLEALRASVVPDAARRYLEHYARAGVRLGAIKPQALARDAGLLDSLLAGEAVR